MKPPLIPTWSSPRERRELARLAAGRTVLEIGAYLGDSTILMAKAGATVWSVDWHRGDSGGDPGLGPQNTLPRWWANVRHHQVEDFVVGLIGTSHRILPRLQPQMFDLAFIDADHGYVSVKADIILARPLLKPGGLLVFHDYCPSWPGVVQAVDELREVSGLFALYDSLAVIGSETAFARFEVD